MKTRYVLMAVAFAAVTSATAYAEMQHGQSHDQPGHGVMHHDMQKMKKKMHGKMQGGQGAQHSGDQHSSAPPQSDRGPSSAAFNAINQRMHEAMNITFTGNVDADFVNSMIPHHEGAVDMAKVVVAFGSDPEIRRLAEAIIRAQEAEIAMMRMWLQRKAQ